MATGRGAGVFDPIEPRADLQSLLHECSALIRAGLVRLSDGTTPLDIDDISPALLEVTDLGLHMSQLLGVDTIEEKEIKSVLDLFNRKGALWEKDEPPGGVT